MTEQTPPLIKCQDVSYNINGNSILDSISLEFQFKSWTGILGPSGSGKSTFLRCLNRLISFSDGSITYHEQPIESYPPSELRKKICLIQQKPLMIPGSVRENLTVVKDWDPEFKTTNSLLEKTLNQVGLQAFILDQDARSLSSGEQQRISLARGLLNNPEVLLLDEPTSNLDPRLARQILDTIQSLAFENNLTIIMVSHDHSLLKKYATDVGIMINGKLIETGPPTILDHPREHDSIQFLMKEPS